MKKLLKFIFFFIVFVLIVLFTAPLLFKGKIMTIAKEQINNNVNAKANFEDINLSFFKNFPYLNAGIKELSVVGLEEFSNDTLIYVKSIDIAVDVISAIKMENINVKRIIVSEPLINAMVLEDGKANWDIAKEKEKTEEEETDTAGSGFDANIALKVFKISGANIFFTDNKAGMKASLENFNFDLSGDLSQDFSKLLINSNTDKLNFVLSGIKYMKDVNLNIRINLDADLKNMNFNLLENSFALNDFILNLDGNFSMPDSADMDINLNYKTNNAEFKSLLSLVPAIYMRDFQDLKAGGNISLDGKIKGKIGEKELPNVDGKLIVSKAKFSYPDLPKSADNININIAYHYDGKQMDNTTVDINKFHVEFGGNPIDLTLNLKTPISDPFVNSQLLANIDLATFSDIIPLEDTKIRGKINSNLDMMGNLSLIEDEKYEEFKAEGTLKIADFFFSSPDMPKPFSIQQADIAYSPQYLHINNFKSTMGKSDFALNGKVSDFLPFIFKDKTIHGELNFTAGTIDLNELIPSSPEETEESTEDTASIQVIEVPANIDFALNSNITNLYYDKLEMKNVIGMIYIKDSRVVLEKLNMNALAGALTVNGEYNTKDINNPLVDFKFQANEIDIPMAVASFGVLEKIAPIVSKTTGRVSLGMDYSSFLTKQMKPVLKSIVGAGNLSSNKVGVNGSNSFSAIGKQLNLDEFKKMILKNINIDFEVLGGKLLVNPFDTKMGSTDLTISGEQDFENNMDYGINLSAPKSLFGSSNSSLNELYAANPLKDFDIKTSETVNLLVNLTGKMNKPKVKIKPVAGLKETTESIKQEFKNTAQETIDTKKEEAKAKARAEADKIMASAEKQAAKIRAQGKVAADKVRSEANANANKMVKEAKNPLLKKAAEVGAKEVREEGEKKARRIEKESDEQAQKILDSARKKSDQLLK